MTVAIPEKQLQAPPAEAVPKPRRWLKTIALIVFWQLIALLFIEVVMFSAGLGEEEIFRLDKEIGFKHIPNKRIYWKQEGPGVYSHFDADGMREPNLQISKPAGTYRIAVLGDSLVEGLQSEIEKTFGYVLGEKLTKKMQRKVEVLNFGNSGYSTAQEYLQLKKVWKYSPDMVVLGYSNRDIFENWSPPDETISNVRPYALHLPNSHLVVDNSSVTGWMRTPRAKFLLAIGPIREYSHIWGMISAAETQFGHTDPVYKAICEFLNNPIKAIRTGWKNLPATIASAPQYALQALSGFTNQAQHYTKQKASPNNIEEQLAASKMSKGQTAALEKKNVSTEPTPVVEKKNVSTDQSSGRKGKDISTAQTSALKDEKISTAQADAAEDIATQSMITKAPDTIPNQPSTKGIAKKQRGVFVDLLARTLGSLLAEMKSESAKHGAKFVVITMPSKSELCPAPGQPADSFALTYPEEVDLVKKLCGSDAIPVYDAESAMAQVPMIVRSANFYSNHLTPKGHAFVERGLQPFIEKQIQGD